tara:strand:- start:9716 stop:10267 length:552 start_codon:yes stop_codon:yes gene_type:complete
MDAPCDLINKLKYLHMKRILSFITLFALLLTSCTGDQGPPGFDGEVAPAFEIENVDFTSENDYTVRENYGFEVFPTEVTLVYILWKDNPGHQQDVWRLVPQTIIFEDGNDLVYNFEFTSIYVDFFLEGSNLEILDDIWTQNKVFRVVVVPAINVGRGTNINNVDYSDIKAVIEAYNITEFSKR